jgi:tetratricopeptide (TPR) repeat protein
VSWEAARIYGEVCLWLLRARWWLTRRKPVFVTVAGFEGEREWSRALQDELMTELRARLGELTDPEVLVAWGRRVGPGKKAQRLCRRRRSACLLYGTRGEDGRPRAHIVFDPGDAIRHIDQYSRDETSIARSALAEPGPEHSRIAAREVGEIAAALALFVPEKLAAFGFEPEGGLTWPPLPRAEDELSDELHCLRAAALAGRDRRPEAYRLITGRLAERRAPRLLAEAYLLLGMGGAEVLGIPSEEAHRLSLEVLREAAGFPDYPDRPTMIYNLLQILPTGHGEEGVSAERRQILDELRGDPTYRRAWWVERMRGALDYYKASRVRATAGARAARPAYRRAARHYSRALALRRRSRQLDPPLGPTAPSRMPRPPVLRANAYDAHHLAGHPLRAAWHHRLAQRAVRRLYKIGLRAMGASDWFTAVFAFQRLLTVGWSDETAARANVFAAAATRQLGDPETSEAFWQRALEIDRRAATQVRAGLRAAGTVSGLTLGLPGDPVEAGR